MVSDISNFKIILHRAVNVMCKNISVFYWHNSKGSPKHLFVYDTFPLIVYLEDQQSLTLQAYIKTLFTFPRKKDIKVVWLDGLLFTQLTFYICWTLDAVDVMYGQSLPILSGDLDRELVVCPLNQEKNHELKELAVSALKFSSPPDGLEIEYAETNKTQFRWSEKVQDLVILR
jgi:hypothetical protein